MTPLELEYVRTCTQSHKRDIVLVKTNIRYANLDNESIIRMLTRIENNINLMYITLEAETPAETPETTTAEVKDNG